MRDDDPTTFNPAGGDPPSAEFVGSLLEKLDVAWHSRTDGHSGTAVGVVIDDLAEALKRQGIV
jgi:hypothetical protein